LIHRPINLALFQRVTISLEKNYLRKRVKKSIERYSFTHIWFRAYG